MASIPVTPEMAAAFERKFGIPYSEIQGRFTNYGEGVTGYEGGRTITNSQYGPYLGDEKLGNYVFQNGDWVPVPEASGSLFGDFIEPIALFASLAAGGNMLAGLGEAGAAAGAAEAGSLANTGYIDALGGLTDATGTALSGWGDIATTAGTAAGTAGGVQTVADLGYVDTLGGMGGGVAGGVEGGIGGASIGAGGMEAGLPAFAGGAGEISPTLLSQLNTALGTNFTGTDVMRTLGNLSAAGLGAYASSEQTGALDEMAKRYEGYGAPYRQKLSDLYANPESFLSSKEVQTPVDLGTKSLMRSLSVTGNPFGSGNALTEGQNYASNKLFSRLGEEKDRLAGYGGITTYNAAAPTAATNAIGSSANTYNAIGSGLGNIFNPPKTESQTMADFIKTLRG